MTTPVKKSQKALQDNKRKPTAQELHQQTQKTPPPVNPTNAADPSSTADGPVNTRTGYSTPDSPGEGEDTAVNSLDKRKTPDITQEPTIAGDGDEDYPVKDNPKMSDVV